MLPAILTLMAFQLVGEAVRDAFSLPIPGPVIGMFLLAAVLVIRGRRVDRVPPALEATADTLISHMGLLFVPAGVGIIAEADLLRQQWLPVVAAVVGSTVLSPGSHGAGDACRPAPVGAAARAGGRDAEPEGAVVLTAGFGQVWTPLAAAPLFWLVATLAAYLIGKAAQRVCGGSALANPVLIAVALVAALVEVSGTPYVQFLSGAQFINFLLGPVTVALAVPLAKNIGLVRANLHGIGLALLAGSLTSMAAGGGDRLGAGRGAAGRIIDGGEGRHHTHRHGSLAADWRHTCADCRPGDPRRHRGRDNRPTNARPHADQRLARARPGRRGGRERRRCRAGGSPE